MDRQFCNGRMNTTDTQTPGHTAPTMVTIIVIFTQVNRPHVLTFAEEIKYGK